MTWARIFHERFDFQLEIPAVAQLQRAEICAKFAGGSLLLAPSPAVNMMDHHRSLVRTRPLCLRPVRDASGRQAAGANAPAMAPRIRIDFSGRDLHSLHFDPPRRHLVWLGLFDDLTMIFPGGSFF